MGSYHNRYLPVAGNILQYLGTETLNPEDIANEFYKLACSFNMSVRDEETRITISGLSENLEEAVELFEHLVANARIEEETLQRYLRNLKNSRENSKADQRTNFSALVDYATYGADNPTRFVLTNEELENLSPERIISVLQDLWLVERKIVFFGPQTVEELTKVIDNLHPTPGSLMGIEAGTRFTPRETNENKVYFAHYDANQSYLRTTQKGIPYNPEIVPLATMYNQYFGGGMNAIVFQEMREKRGLAYSAWASYASPSHSEGYYVNTSFIATQNDKVADAFNAFDDLFNNIPLSETTFRLAQEQIISNIRTQRIRGTGVIWNYLSAQRMGRDYDLRETLYHEIPAMTLEQVQQFNLNHIKDKPKTYVILGNENIVDFDEIEKLFGPVTRLTKDDLFVF